MEAFLTDGLRSLINVPANTMGEYTVRWPGHIQRYQNTTLNPEELVDAWRFDPQRDEFTWMEVRGSGWGNAVWTVEDQGKDGDSSMGTTGLVTFMCVVAWSQQELFTEGIHPPEDLPSEVIYKVIETLKDEGVRIELKTQSMRTEGAFQMEGTQALCREWFEMLHLSEQRFERVVCA